MDCRTGFQFTSVRYTPRTMCQAVWQAQGQSSEQPLGPGCMRCAAAHPPEGLAPGNAACSCGEARGKTTAATGQRAGWGTNLSKGQASVATSQAAGATVLLSYLPHSRSWAVEPQAKQGGHRQVSRKPSLASKKKSPETKRWFLDRLWVVLRKAKPHRELR